MDISRLKTEKDVLNKTTFEEIFAIKSNFDRECLIDEIRDLFKASHVDQNSTGRQLVDNLVDTSNPWYYYILSLLSTNRPRNINNRKKKR